MLELHLLPELLRFADIIGYDIEHAEKQNWYPGFTFICRNNVDIKFADEIDNIPAVIRDFIFFAAEKWRIASDKSGSGNTANIGSIQYINDILTGNGVFAKVGEEFFNDYWINFGRIIIPCADGQYKRLSSFAEYLRYRGLSESLNNPRKSKRAGQ